jgi:hypothetical protein
MEYNKDGHPVRRSLVDQDRTQGGVRSLSIETIGDWKIFHATTGELADGASYDVYLTEDGLPGGERFFDKTPQVSVSCDASARYGGMARGHGPVGPNDKFEIEPCDTFSVQWSRSRERFFVRVTNSTGAASDFVVVASGV